MEFETALLIVPPPPIQAFAYPLRQQYDTQSFNQVPAHITLLYPFIQPEEIESAVDRLGQILKACSPFDLTLDRYGQFKDTLFLEPSNPEPVAELYRFLAEAYPEYPIYKGEHDGEYHPHLTLARFSDPSEVEAMEIPPTPSFTFTVKQLHIYLGSPEAEEPFIPRARITLGPKE